MEKLALVVWLTITVGSLAGCADNHVAAAPDGFPPLPVPAGTLSEARESLDKALFFYRQDARTQEIPCSSCQPRA